MGRTAHAGLVRVATAVALGTLGVGLAPATAPVSAQVTGEQVLYSFAGANGAGPLSGVIVGPDGVIYGTTVFGGAHGDGCVFSLTPLGSGYSEQILFNFDGADGAKPAGDVVANAAGDLYGDTVVGGAHGDGVVFELVPVRAGYAERALYSFTGLGDGNEPIGAPVLNPHGDVFGVTQFGGAFGQGVVFEVTPSPTGDTEVVLHSFAGDAGQPQAGLTRASDGTLYGTLYGASEVNQYGTVFRLRLRRSGPVYTDLYDFKGGTDGANPFAVLTLAGQTGVIYGTTQYGGGVRSYGTVFSLTPDTGGYREAVLHAFSARRQGVLPESPLLLQPNGDLLGTADIGGSRCSGIGCGTVFRLAPDGSAYTFHLLYRFRGPPDGAEPEWSGLAEGPGGQLLGTTRSGGMSSSCGDGGPGGVLGCGTVYALTS
jgi:uncharacterized repeat protein (TIGR03803 family)